MKALTSHISITKKYIELDSPDLNISKFARVEPLLRNINETMEEKYAEIK